MPIDPAVAVGAELPGRDLAWNSTDVLLYHLAVGAGADELSYVYENTLRGVLPSCTLDEYFAKRAAAQSAVVISAVSPVQRARRFRSAAPSARVSDHFPGSLFIAESKDADRRCDRRAFAGTWIGERPERKKK